MKTVRHKRNSGFSLIELLVVISIILILAGLVAASLPGIQASINRKNTQNFLAELQNGLESYQIDNGIYPQVPGDGDRSSRGLKGSEVLYKSLSGDYKIDDGKVDTDEKIYVQRLDYWSNRDSTTPRSAKAESSYLVIDTFTEPVRYIADPPNIAPDERTTFNPTYDLWSTAGAPADSEISSDKAKYITNWTYQ